MALWSSALPSPSASGSGARGRRVAGPRREGSSAEEVRPPASGQHQLSPDARPSEVDLAVPLMSRLLGRQHGSQPAQPSIPTFLPPETVGEQKWSLWPHTAACWGLALLPRTPQPLTANPGDSWRSGLGGTHTLGLQVHLLDRGTRQPRGCLGKELGAEGWPRGHCPSLSLSFPCL